MLKSVSKLLKKAVFLLFTVPGLSSCLTRCPETEIKSIFDSIPDPETKNEGFDLKGWEYKTVKSEASGETYYYYHMPSKKPDAPAFVLVHGMFLDGRTFLNLDNLASDFELFAIELPHESKYFKGQVEDFPNLLQDFLDTMKIERMYLGGVSLGGQISMFYMVYNAKTTVDGLVLITTDMVKSQKELDSAKKNANRILKITDDDDKKMLCLLNKLVTRKKQKAKESEQEVLKIFTIKNPSFYRQVLYTAENMKEPPDLGKIKVPTLIILADADSTIPFDKARHLPSKIEGSELKVLKGAEHDAAFTSGPEVAELIQKKFSGK